MTDVMCMGTYQQPPARCCATCKHWDQRYRQESVARNRQLIAENSWLANRSPSAELELEWGECSQLHTSELLDNGHDADQWWRTPLQTHQSFGCVLYELKRRSSACTT